MISSVFGLFAQQRTSSRADRACEAWSGFCFAKLESITGPRSPAELTSTELVVYDEGSTECVVYEARRVLTDTWPMFRRENIAFSTR